MKIMIVFAKGLINGSGGCEKVTSILGNYLYNKGHDVIIATNENKTGELFFPIKDGIKFQNIYTSCKNRLFIRSVTKYRGKNLFKKLINKFCRFSIKLINFYYNGLKSYEEIYKNNLLLEAENWKSYIDKVKPDIILTISISSLVEMTYHQTYDIPIIDSVNGRPDYDYGDTLYPRPQWEMDLLKNEYRKLSGIQVLFENYISFLPKTFTGYTKVIPNMVKQFNPDCIDKTHKCNKIIMVGRIDKGKNQIMAVDAFKKIAKKYPNWIMEFYGEGIEEANLKNKITSENLEKQIFIKGRTTAVFEKLTSADIFIFPSKFEGFPLALTEAFSVGLPAIGLKTCSGVNELIKDGENGFLVSDTDEMADKLELLINDEQLRKQMGYNAQKSVEQYAPEKVLQAWEDFLISINSKENQNV